MRRTFVIPDIAQRTRLVSILLLLILTVPACGVSAGDGDPEVVQDNRSAIAVRDGRIPQGEPAIGCDAVVINGGLAAGGNVTIPPQGFEARTESPEDGFFARVLKPLLLRVARRIIALQFRELIPGGTS